MAMKNWKEQKDNYQDSFSWEKKKNAIIYDSINIIKAYDGKWYFNSWVSKQKSFKTKKEALSYAKSYMRSH